ncbi:MAG: hypothetical protein HXY38_11905 [Chloroflexi bacterium]|nr:hypothetical protein [Chloroflexota bacterium]
MRKRIIPIFIGILVLLTGTTYFWVNSTAPKEPQPEMAAVATRVSTAISANAPKTLPLGSSPLKHNIISAGDYLVRQQLANGELAYQVNVLTDERASTPSYIRLIGGVSALYTVCRVAEDSLYCEAGDRAIKRYLSNLLADPTRFTGACLYANGACPLGGAAATVNAIYKRWQATGSVMLGERNLLGDAAEFGYFIVSMRRPEGGFFHSFDPHFEGTVNPNYVDPAFNGEGLAALLQLYEMTGNEFWLQQARDVNDFMRTQPVTEDYGHSYAFALFARLSRLEKADQDYAEQIADAVIAGQIRSLNPANSSIATATKIEALSSIAQALALEDAEHDWLNREIQTFITFVQARQFPANDCSFEFAPGMIERYKGGIFNTCEDPSIRVDGVQRWVNGLALYLEYLGMK